MTQSIMDALADAETLSLVAHAQVMNPSRVIGGRHWIYRYTGPEAGRVRKACRRGIYIHANEDYLVANAIAVARVAFRAVPGLRG